MMDDLKFKCGACGGQTFMCDNDPPLPDDMIACKQCTKPVGTLDEITKMVLAASKTAVATTEMQELRQLRKDIFGK